MIEIFKDIKDLEGLYQVSNFGKILSLNYNGTSKPRLMKTVKNKYGYLVVKLFKDRKPKMFRVHRLVAEAFLPNPLNKPYINHKIEGDEGKKINIVYINEDGSIDEENSTIEWVTAKENINYGTCIQRRVKNQTNRNKSKTVLQFTLDGEFIREWPSTRECERNGFNKGHVSSCCNGKRKSHKGFRWEYKKEVV